MAYHKLFANMEKKSLELLTVLLKLLYLRFGIDIYVGRWWAPKWAPKWVSKWSPKTNENDREKVVIQFIKANSYITYDEVSSK